LRKKDESFTHQIKALFATLKELEDRAAVNHFQGTYRLSIYSPRRLVEALVGEECLHHHYVSWRVHLLDPYELPQISSIVALKLHNCVAKHRYSGEDWKYYGRGLPSYCAEAYNRVESKLDVRVIVDLATTLPNLEYLGVKTGGFEWCPTWKQDARTVHYEKDWEGPRRDARLDFARTVTADNFQLTNSMTKASLDFLNPLERSTAINHDACLPDLVGPARRDLFSSSLRILSNNLRQLRLRAMVDDCVFWPDNDMASFGPNLELLEFMFHPARPDGKWYFQGPGDEGSDAAGFEVTGAFYPPFMTTEIDTNMDLLQEKDYDRREFSGNTQFRGKPHEANLRPLLEGFAKAATHMRCLKEALIWYPLDGEPDYQGSKNFDKYDMSNRIWGIYYSAPGTSPQLEPFNKCWTRQLGWMVKDWRPDPELGSIFQQIGRDEHRGDLRETWAEDVDRMSVVEWYHKTLWWSCYSPHSR
jgi:hypothetical protein